MLFKQLVKAKIASAIFSALFTLTSVSAMAETVVGTANEPLRMEEVSILGDPDDVAAAAGSAHLLDETQLSRFEQGDIHRVLQAVPGVYLQEEDGAGLRPNIGIRGSGLDRSARIALLEDGVLIAPAPYAAPAAYYFPVQRRMRSVEVLKGPSAVRLGSRTTGGALNLLSTTIPVDRSANIELFGGTDAFKEGHAWYGDSSAHAGWMLETVQQRSDGFKELDGGGETGYDVRDYLAKLRLNSVLQPGINHGLELKAGYTSQVSDETYLGLTDADFAVNPYRRYAASGLDQFQSTHRQYAANYFLRPVSSSWKFDLTVYENRFSRNWFKLDSVDGVGISALLSQPTLYPEQMRWVRGVADSPDDALKLRNNNRDYISRGVQSVASIALDGGRARHDLRLGLRLHSDEEDRFQHDDLYSIRQSELLLSTPGLPGSQSNRVSDAHAKAIFLEDKIKFSKWELTPGLRFEKIRLGRADYSTADPERIADPVRDRQNSVSVLIPGLAFSRLFDNGVQFFGGMHRGFNPPAPGSSADVEDSRNFELGLRHQASNLRAEAIAFYNDYDNLVGSCTASTGGACQIGDQFDGGAATVGGIESLLEYDTGLLGKSGLSLPLRLAYTWTAIAEFDNSFASDFGPWGNVVRGDEMPYLPEHQLLLAADLTAIRWGIGLNLSYVGQSRTVAGQGAIPAEQSIDAHWVMDLAGSFQLADNFEIFGRVDNLLDETYVVARRPAGLRPGKLQTIVAGFRLSY